MPIISALVAEAGRWQVLEASLGYIAGPCLKKKKRKKKKRREKKEKYKLKGETPIICFLLCSQHVAWFRHSVGAEKQLWDD
jgi:hypothetical protein